MELCEAEAFRVFDHHHRRFRNVDADFDHSRGDKQARLAACDTLHRPVLVRALHAAVDEIDHVTEPAAEAGVARLGGGEIALFRIFNQWADPINATASFHRASYRGLNLFHA